MKGLLFPILLLVGACNARRHPVESDYPGTYTRYMVDDAGTLFDTLTIGYPGDREGPVILVCRATSVINKDDNGQPLPAVRRRVQLTATFNEERGIVDVNETGEQYILLPGDTVLFNGYVQYTRIR